MVFQKKKAIEEEDEMDEVEEEVEEEVPVPKPKTAVKKPTWNLVQVPSEYGLAIKNEKTDEVFDTNSALVYILNLLEDIKKGVS